MKPLWQNHDCYWSVSTICDRNNWKPRGGKSCWQDLGTVKEYQEKLLNQTLKQERIIMLRIKSRQLDGTLLQYDDATAHESRATVSSHWANLSGYKLTVRVTGCAIWMWEFICFLNNITVTSDYTYDIRSYFFFFFLTSVLPHLSSEFNKMSFLEHRVFKLYKDVFSLRKITSSDYREI